MLLHTLSFPPDAPGVVNLWLADLKDTAQHHAEMIYHEGNDKEKTDTCETCSHSVPRARD